MRTNPLLKVEYLVNRRVYTNPAVVCFNVTVREMADGAVVRGTKTFRRDIFIKNPHSVSEKLLDSQGTFSKETPNYMKGDLIAEIAAKEIMDAVAMSLESDPVVSVGGSAKMLAELRPVDAVTCGIMQNVDSLVWNGQEWRFVGIEPKDFFAGVPASLKCQLRRM